jgi:hypothetical protein
MPYSGLHSHSGELMNLQKYGLLTEIIGLVAIVATLIVLIVEVSGNTLALEAATRQGFASQDQAFFQSIIDTSVVAEAWAKRDAGQELTPLESSQLMHREHLNFRIFEHAYSQYQLGTLQAAEWDRYENVIRIVMANNEAARQMWERYETVFAPEFVAVVEAVRAE